MDSDAREKIINDLDTNYLVEAGAGTGKTTLLVNRIINILATGRATLSQIVAITFTEKAGQELKTRIKQSLEQILQNHSQSSLGNMRLEHAISDLEHAEITTIHGFCSSILQDFSIEAGVPLNMSVADETMSQSLYHNAWEEWILLKSQNQDELLLDLLRLGLNIEQLNHIANLLHNHRDLLESWSPKFESFHIDGKEVNVPIFSSSEITDDSTQKILSLQKWLANEIPFFENLLPSCHNQEDRGYARLQSLLTEWKFLINLNEKEWFRRIIYGIDIKIEGNKKNWQPSSDLDKIKERLYYIKSIIEQFSLLVRHNLLQRCIVWLLEFLLYYRNIKYQKRVLDFEDLLIFTRNLLKNNKTVRKELQQKYEFILVDEFQDTDPLQVEIVFFLAEKDAIAEDWKNVELLPGKFFAVGDPKQAIYRFRRADIEMYQEVKQLLNPNACLAITQNFRSSPEIISWVNNTFSTLIQKTESFQPQYIPLQTSQQQIDNVHSVYSLKFTSVEAQEEKLLMKYLIAQEAQLIAQMIQKMFQEQWPVRTKNGIRPIVFSDIALLLRRFSYIDVFERALNAMDIPYQVIGSKSYYSRIEIKSLIFLLEAIVEPYNSISVVAVLKSPIFALSDEDLFLHYQQYQTFDYRDCVGIKPENKLYLAYNVLSELHQEYNHFTLSIYQFLEKIYEKTGLLFTFMSMSQGDQRLANLQKINELAYNFSKFGSHDLNSFVQWIAQLSNRNSDESENYLDEDSLPSVKIISIHKSKGLEFPAVFLGDLGVKVTRNPDIVISRNEKSFELRLQGKIELKTKQYDELVLLEKEKEDAEERRLLYVAATRARDYLLLPNVAQDRGYGLWLAPFLQDSLFCQQLYLPENFQKKNIFIENPSQSLQANEIKKNFDWKKNFQDWQNQQKQYWQICQQLPQFISSEIATVPFLPIPPNRAIWERSERCRKVLENTITILLASYSNSEKKSSEKLFALLQKPKELRNVLEPILASESYQNRLTNDESNQTLDLVLKVLNSGVFRRVLQSERYFSNMPFSWKCGNRHVVGTFPLIFWESQSSILVLYKNQDITTSQASRISSWYRWEIAFYMIILKQIANIIPKETILFFVKPNLPIAIHISNEVMDQVAKKLEITH